MKLYIKDGDTEYLLERSRIIDIVRDGERTIIMRDDRPDLIIYDPKLFRRLMDHFKIEKISE